MPIHPSNAPHIVVVGAGMAGLAAASRIAFGERRGGSPSRATVEVLEASDRVGGRVATDVVEGPGGAYLVDRGFQVYLSPYAWPARWLDLKALDLKAFMPGALVWNGARAATVAHPLREPLAAIAGVVAGIVPPRDALRMLPFARAALRGPATEAGEPAGVSALSRLEAAGISRRTIDTFFRSFFGGVFFDRSLETDASRLDFLLRMFAEGFACVPAGGMGEIAARMAQPLGNRVATGRRVERVETADDGSQSVVLADGSRRSADAVIVATGAHDLARLVPGNRMPDPGAIEWCGTMSAWFATPDRSRLPKWLVLNGSGRGAGTLGAFSHGAAMSSIAPGYAPAGRGLFVANTAYLPRDADTSRDLAEDMRRTLREILGAGATDGWELLRVQRIRHALPRQWPQDLSRRMPSMLSPRLFVAGDHLEDASINGAVRSGHLAAESCLQALGAA